MNTIKHISGPFVQLSDASFASALKDIDKELSALPDGNLIMNRKPGKTYFSCSIGGERHGIERDKAMIYALARKRYLKLKRKHLNLTIRTPGRCAQKELDDLTSRIDSLLDDCKHGDLDIARITLTNSQYSWMNERYRSNQYHPESLQYITNSGIHVRSKSERTIGNRLERFGIPYRYEQEVEIDVSSMENIAGARLGKYKTYYPDFIIMRPNGEKIIWEHLGLLNHSDYRESAFEKIFIYRQVGLVKEKDMIITVESDLTDTSMLDDIIVRRVLTY